MIIIFEKKILYIYIYKRLHRLPLHCLRHCLTYLVVNHETEFARCRQKRRRSFGLARIVVTTRTHSSFGNNYAIATVDGLLETFSPSLQPNDCFRSRATIVRNLSESEKLGKRRASYTVSDIIAAPLCRLGQCRFLAVNLFVSVFSRSDLRLHDVPYKFLFSKPNLHFEHC